jgi:hypothetical protein
MVPGLLPLSPPARAGADGGVRAADNAGHLQADQPGHGLPAQSGRDSQVFYYYKYILNLVKFQGPEDEQHFPDRGHHREGTVLFWL